MLTRGRILIALVFAMTPAAMCVAQIPVNFSAHTSSNVTSSITGGTPYNIYSADLNNDGLTDIIQDVGNSLDQFAVSLANGDGTFRKPVNYSYPAGGAASPRAALALGDFNGDGSVDLVAAIIGTSKLALYLGNGDGTLQPPRTYSLNLSVNGSNSIADCRIVTADFNHDGNLDVVISGATANNANLYVLPGNGDGTFAPARAIYSTPVSPTGFKPVIKQLATGDFNGDSNADIELSQSQDDFPDDWAVYVLSGDGHFGFTSGHITEDDHIPSGFILGAGDLNGDGTTDIIAIEPDVYFLLTFSGFGGHIDQIPYTHYGTGSGLAPQIAVADFNDDGQMDFALTAGLGNANYFVFFLGQGNGHFSTQTWDLTHYANQSNPVVGLFNFVDKADVALVQYNSAGNSVITDELNTTAHGVWSNCPYPLHGSGISLCSPTSSVDGSLTAPVNFNATAHSFGQLRKMELWVGGNKLAEQANVWGSSAFFNVTTSPPPGSYRGTIFATDIDNTQQRLDFNFTVGGTNCAAPTTDAVRICSVIVGSGGVLVQAGATVSGPLARMELWVDSAKEYTETTSNNLSATISVPAGTHRLTVVAVNTAGTLWYQTVNLAVP